MRPAGRALFGPADVLQDRSRVAWARCRRGLPVLSARYEPPRPPALGAEAFGRRTCPRRHSTPSQQNSTTAPAESPRIKYPICVIAMACLSPRARRHQQSTPPPFWPSLHDLRVLFAVLLFPRQRLCVRHGVSRRQGTATAARFWPVSAHLATNPLAPMESLLSRAGYALAGKRIRDRGGPT